MASPSVVFLAMLVSCCVFTALGYNQSDSNTVRGIKNYEALREGNVDQCPPDFPIECNDHLHCCTAAYPVCCIATATCCPAGYRCAGFLCVRVTGKTDNFENTVLSGKIEFDWQTELGGKTGDTVFSGSFRQTSNCMVTLVLFVVLAKFMF